eukprot:CAMPEP_0171565736 /NCGR_PEP_ID=MMETSP0961-20121227/142_1 /TAXON_ID=87120 /ORGANISM="Aurantiochytrium limacinum, Strain ATCCMYA-1381" /LENGTH=553 /DNA_ID=CAMNT_0012119323 /DNA_START=65 /DNA_END=1726 /DNA_ORIENTATION=+
MHDDISAALCVPTAFTRAVEDIVLVVVSNGWLSTKELLPIAATCGLLSKCVDDILRQKARELRLLNVRLIEVDFVKLVHRCRALSAVELHNCGTELSDVALFALHGLQLRELRIHACPALSAAALRELVQLAPEFLHNIRILDVDLGPLFETDQNTGEAFCPRMPDLQELGLTLNSGAEFSNMLSILSGAVHTLKILRMHKFQVFEALSLLAEPNVQTQRKLALDELYIIDGDIIDYGDVLTAAGYNRLRDHISLRLQKFECNSKFCSDYVLAKIAAESARSLRSLSLGSKDAWSTLEPIGKLCTELQELSVINRAHFGDTLLSPVLAGCHALRSLHVSGARGLSSISVRSAAVSCPNLARLNLPGCELVDDGALHAIATFSTSITELDLTGCKLITDKGLKALAQSKVGAQVHTLTVASCSKLSDEGLLAIPRWMHAIRRFDCSWCTFVTIFSLEEIIMECPVLACVRIHGNPIPTTDAIVLAKRSQGPFELDLGSNEVYYSSGRPRKQDQKPEYDPEKARARRRAAARARVKARAKKSLQTLEQTLQENAV